MFIHRDISQQLSQNPDWIQILIGPRQCGKSTLFATLGGNFQEVTLDDLRLRQLAQNDPALFFQQFEPPLIIDEVQYAPNLFPELKKRIDQLKRKALLDPAAGQKKPKVLFRLTGSDQILIDKNIKETLTGRASYYYLNTCTVDEILRANAAISIKEILFKGGWPELYANENLSVVNYLNEYIRTCVEKDIVISAGIQKISAFHMILGLLAARTGQLLDYANISKDSGISGVTVKDWVSTLERADFLYLLKPFATSLNKRLIKTPKIYFLDTGLATRLQGWSDSLTLFNSPQIGALFETLALAEIVKFIRNYKKDWKLFFWRTKDGDEIDFVLQTNTTTFHGFEVKLSLQNMPKAISYPAMYEKLFSPQSPLIIITFGGSALKLSSQCSTLPIAELHDYLMKL